MCFWRSCADKESAYYHYYSYWKYIILSHESHNKVFKSNIILDPLFWIDNNYNIGDVSAIAEITYKNIILKIIQGQTTDYVH